MEKNKTPQSVENTSTVSQQPLVTEKPVTEAVNENEKVSEPYQDVEFGNMTDVAIKHFIVTHPDIPKDRKVGEFTVEQWLEASDLGFKTPQKLKEYRGF